MNPGFIFSDIEGVSLTSEDREIITHPAILGIILFSKNFESKSQLKALTTSLRKIKPQLLISVDQEGGRVQRFREGFTALPPMQYWGERFEKEGESVLEALTATTETMVTELQAVGINMSLVPVLDVDHGLSEIIGERSFSADPAIITTLAQTMIETMHQHHMPVMAKHYPGHGGVTLDSHKALPVDQRDWETLWEVDIKPFLDLSHMLDAVMPAHVIYEKVDAKPAGFSSHWLRKILRQQIGFKGVIVSDDLTMSATESFGAYPERAGFALEAGCDILSICNNREGLVEVLDYLEKYSNPASQKIITNYIRKII